MQFLFHSYAYKHLVDTLNLLCNVANSINEIRAFLPLLRYLFQSNVVDFVNEMNYDCNDK